MTQLQTKPLLIRSPELHSHVYGVHGAIGTTGWKGLFTRRDLRSATEAVEWAYLPVSSVSGEHRHTRTEEIYLLLKGEGEYALNGEIHPFKAGMLALMVPGHTHGIRNTGHQPLSWLVIETLSPETERAMNNQRISRSENIMTPRIDDLHHSRRVETAGTFHGPLKAVERHEMRGGNTLSIDSPGFETACFLNTGKARLQFGDTEVEIKDPSSFLVPLGAKATIIADTDVELYVIDLKVPVQ